MPHVCGMFERHQLAVRMSTLTEGRIKRVSTPNTRYFESSKKPTSTNSKAELSHKIDSIAKEAEKIHSPGKHKKRKNKVAIDNIFFTLS